MTGKNHTDNLITSVDSDNSNIVVAETNQSTPYEIGLKDASVIILGEIIEEGEYPIEDLLYYAECPTKDPRRSKTAVSVYDLLEFYLRHSKLEEHIEIIEKIGAPTFYKI